ncbi:MAG TPA: hypothetical protein VGM29_07960 [Polyangiaceae bacterium]|jgi:hypothetical protein
MPRPKPVRTALALLVLATRLRAAPTDPEPAAASPAEPVAPTPAREYRVDFSADRVEVDPKLGTLELDGNVHVNAQRYQLTSEHLRLNRGPRGVEADGSSRVAFCACPDAPITLHATSATLAPPTDALFSNAAVEVGGVPVLWLPGLWLRAPTRVGLTLPGVSYRGQDGFLVGAGAHLPLLVDAGQVKSALDVGVGTYVARGARVETELTTESSTSRVAWDHVGNSALEIDAHGSGSTSGETVAFRADAERGPRGRIAPSSLDLAARRMDRARVGLVHAGDLVVGLGLRTDIARGSSLRDYGAFGPELFVGYGTGLGSSASVDLLGATRTTVLDGHALTHLSQRAELSGELRPGPLGVGLRLGDTSVLDVSEKRVDGDVRTGAESRVGLPLVRQFGRIAHWLEPLALARGIVDTVPRGEATRSQRTAILSAGVDTSLGDRAARQAASLSLRGAWLRDARAAEPALTSRLAADARYVGASERVAYLTDQRSLVSLSRVRFGANESLHLGLHADGASVDSAARARPLFDEEWLETPVPLLDRPGWNAGAQVGVPLGASLSVGAGSEYDLTARRLLAASSLVRYRHNCGCLALAAFVGHRLGRGGVDAWLGLDLMP